jgi:hypothetical protein
MYKTVTREVFVLYSAQEDYGGDVVKADEALKRAEAELGNVECEYAIPAL